MVRACFGPAALAALALAAALGGCGTDAVGVDACRQIQAARCRQAPACGIAIEPPYHQSGSAVDACIRFYNDECLHGLSSGKDPGPTALSACVAAINGGAMADGGCAVVLSPQTTGACSWLGTTASVDAASE